MKDSVGVLLKKVILEFDKQANQLLAPYDLTHTQYKILMFLYQNPPMMVRQIDIERHFFLTNPTVTGILNNLERKDLVRRQENPADGRSKVLCLTPKAMELRSELNQWSEHFDGIISKDLTPEELAELIRLLNKMLNGSHI